MDVTDREITAYLKSDYLDIAKMVNDVFEQKKNAIRTYLLAKIQGFLNPVPDHYDWRLDNCSYDYSGEIVKSGQVSLDQTVSVFLENEYTGNRTATYVSHYGWNYDSYGDELSYYTLNLGCSIMNDVIRDCLNRHFNIVLSDDEFDDIQYQEGVLFDCIYDNSIADDFFSHELPISFVGIEDLLLSDVVTMDFSHIDCEFLKNKEM